ncbi:MAG TPA: hypothetical protein VK638_31770 [Edaphobacter sp.]|nr:hypothetical protein [Edaphobacter sp.]
MSRKNGSVALRNNTGGTITECLAAVPPESPVSRRRFADDVITLCVRWYLRVKLSYRDVAEIAWELGVFVAPSTILRWVIRCAEEFAHRWRLFEKPVGGSWRCDETYSALSSARFRRV